MCTITRERAWMPACTWICHWSATVCSRAAIASEQRRGRRRAGQLLAIGAVLGEAVAALGRAHDRPARAHDLRGGRHALDRLVEVLVERKAGVRGERRRRRAAGTARIAVRRTSAQARLVHREQLAAEGLRDPLLAVQHDVEREVRARGSRDRAHVVVHRVAHA